MASMEVLNDFRVWCDECGRVYKIKKDYRDYVAECIDERGMGPDEQTGAYARTFADFLRRGAIMADTV